MQLSRSFTFVGLTNSTLLQNFTCTIWFIEISDHSATWRAQLAVVLVYQFSDGELVSSSLAFQAFRTAIREASGEFSFGASFDVSAYFNSIYHHDLVIWFNRDHRSDDDVTHFAKFLRETAA
jgi:hypothetical protein